MSCLPVLQARQLKLYHSFPFRSSRCAWLVNELGAEEYVEMVPIALHGSEPRDLMRYREVITACVQMSVFIFQVIQPFWTNR